MGCCFLLQGIFLTQGSNPCLLGFLHWQEDSLPLSHTGSPLIYVYNLYFIHTNYITPFKKVFKTSKNSFTRSSNPYSHPPRNQAQHNCLEISPTRIQLSKQGHTFPKPGEPQFNPLCPIYSSLKMLPHEMYPFRLNLSKTVISPRCLIFLELFLIHVAWEFLFMHKREDITVVTLIVLLWWRPRYG